MSGVRCLYCGGETAPRYAGIKDRLGFVPGERAFAQCLACESLALDPQPHADELAAFYPPVYSFAPDMGKGSPLKRVLSSLEYHLYFGPLYRVQVGRVMRACGLRRGDGKTLLDIGCGRGLRLLEFRRRGFEVYGFDLQPDVVRYLRDELKIPADCGGMNDVSKVYAAGTLDLITAFFLVEHIPDVRGTLAEMFALLKPGGWLAAAVPLIDSLQAKWFGRRWINVTEAPRHLSLPTRRGLIGACEAVGFTKVRVGPDSALHCAGQVGSSLIPGATLTHAYGGRRLMPLLRRGVGAGVTVAAVPWCAFENHVLGRPALGIVYGQKPV